MYSMQGYALCPARGRPSGLIGRRGLSQRRFSGIRTVPTTAVAVVDEVVKRVEGTDAGVSLTDAEKDEIDFLLDELQKAGTGTQPVKDPRLFGNYNVAYTSVRRALGEKGQPAGGKFRGALGRKLFQTTGVFQSVMPGEPPVAVNKVAFKLFGVLPGYVGLRGIVEPVGEAGDTVNVFFGPPIVSFAGVLNLQLGKKSSVQLITTYLDEKIRIGKGSRGSLFVFTRGGPADLAELDQVGLQQTTLAGKVFLGLLAVASVLGGALLWASANPILRAGAVLAWLATAGIGAVLKGGGAIQDDEARKNDPTLVQRVTEEKVTEEKVPLSAMS